MCDYRDRLLKSDWEVKTVPLSLCQQLVRQYHYSGGCSNTATYRHGLFRLGENECKGVAWWIPPTKNAALATFPSNWRGVLALSRLVVVPGIPKNACTFLLSRSVKLINRTLWPCLVTYADEWQGHKGTIYKACNWTYLGKTNPEATWVINGRMISRKAGPHTRTKREMEAIGATMIGRFSKHKFVKF